MSLDGDPFRSNYGTLEEDQKKAMRVVKGAYENAWAELDLVELAYGPSRDLSVARTQLQTSCMWAVRAVTKTEGQK